MEQGEGQALMQQPVIQELASGAARSQPTVQKEAVKLTPTLPQAKFQESRRYSCPGLEGEDLQALLGLPGDQCSPPSRGQFCDWENLPLRMGVSPNFTGIFSH